MKTVTRENFRVEVKSQANPRYYADAEIIRECEDMIIQVKRHVDNVSSVRIVWDDAGTCSFCGATWTEPEDTYNGGCCEKDEENNPETAETYSPR